MPLPRPEPGLVIHYEYLWRHESARGEERGAKRRPCAIVVAVTTVSGEVTLDCLAPTSVCHVRTVSGDVAVRLPAGHGVGVEARSVSGRVVVDGVEHGDRRPGRTTVDLRDDRATCFVYSQTVSGHLTVLHGAPLAEPVVDAGGA